MEVLEKKVCTNCVGEPFLAEAIKKKGRKLKCSYCNNKAKSLTIEDFSNLIEVGFENFYDRTSPDPDDFEYYLIKHSETDYYWERSGSPVLDCIMEAADLKDEIANDVLTTLAEKHSSRSDDEIGEESDFAIGSFYQQRNIDDEYWQNIWNKLQETLKTESRFFNKIAEEILSTFFKGISELRTKDGKFVIVEAGPNTQIRHLYRGRVFLEDEALKKALPRPDLNLGSPPFYFANAGRMNAKGISVFYGSNSADVALSEVRPPVGSKVAIAKFSLLKPMSLLSLIDLKDLNVDGSIFDPTYLESYSKSIFLKGFSNKISMPVMPGTEDIDYLVTQSIADFLSSSTDLELDGIIFPSVQVKSDSTNIVLFHKSSKVEIMELEESVRPFVHTGMFDGEKWDDFYEVIFEKSSDDPKTIRPSDFITREWLSDIFSDEGNLNFEEPSLRIEWDSIEIRIIESVKYKTTNFPVSFKEIIKPNFDEIKDE